MQEFLCIFLTFYYTEENEPRICQFFHATCHLSSLQQHIKFLLANPYQGESWRGTHRLWGSPKANNCKESLRRTWWPRSSIPEAFWKFCRFDRTWLPNTSCRTSKMIFAVYKSSHYCWKNVSTCYTKTAMTSFCNFCRYRRFVMAPLIRIGSISPCLLIAHHTDILQDGMAPPLLCVEFQKTRTSCSCSRNHRGENDVHQ